ncbi:sugar O-acetyltransferase [Longimicrobium sp.]|uniref:sugar O-acetyltransferase n=1 Tax=Longimicrobium sp. TaxID=2029185 RepID=UPI002C36568B|nr:sugar O-acetyltransferase [Longimicrobium sp.]HSU17025.1 sugar O-acetyltransferase [Longimicrobium sp.]
MTEKEKMLAGELYRASDPELVAERAHAQRLIARFNTLADEHPSSGAAVLRGLLGEVGEGCVVMPSFRCDYGYNIRMGRNTFVNYDCVFLDPGRITIGADVQIAPAVQIYTAGHPLDAEERRSGAEFARPVTIGDGVWIGGGAIICPGVAIGANAVIGAGSVVTRDLPPNVVAAGNPCRVLRELET